MFQFDAVETSNARFALIGAVLGSAWIAISLRLWVRITRSFSWDDGIYLFSALLFTGFCSTAILIQVLVNQHQDQAERVPLALALSIASTELYIAAIAALKTSIAIFFLRHIANTWQRYITHAATAINIVSSVLLGVVTILECGALPRNHLSGKHFVCLSSHMFSIFELATSVSNAATSWTLAIIPIFIIASRAQRLSTALKVCTGCVVLLGGCASVVSVIRVVCMLRGGPGDESYIVPLSVLECGTAIIAASAATLRPLFGCLALPPPISGYVSRPGSEKDLEQQQERSVYEDSMPSRSHFSFFSEASFGPKTWFRGFSDKQGVDQAEDSSLSRRKYGLSLRRKSTSNTSKTANSKGISRPVIVARPAPLNRTESQQYLLRNDSDFRISPSAGRRHAGSPDLFMMYGAVERHI